MHRGRAWLHGIGMLVASSGCSLIVSTSGLSDGPPPGTPSEAGGSEAGLEGGGGEGGSSSGDAGSDAAPDVVSSGPFCDSLSPRPSFCTDFDKGVLTDLFVVQGNAELDTDVARSPARSMLARVDATDTTRYCSVRRDLGVTPSSIDLRVQVYIDDYDVLKDVEIVNLRMEKPGGTCNIYASLRKGFWTFDEYCEGPGTPVQVVHDSTKGWVRRAWTKIGFKVDFTTRKGSLYVDSDTVLSDLTLSPDMIKGPAAVYAGINYVQTGAGRARLNIDDLTFDIR